MTETRRIAYLHFENGELCYNCKNLLDKMESYIFNADRASEGAERVFLFEACFE